MHSALWMFGVTLLTVRSVNLWIIVSARCELAFRFSQILGSHTVIIGVLAIATLNNGQRVAIPADRGGVIVRGEAHVSVPRKRGRIVSAALGVRVLVDVKRTLRQRACLTQFSLRVSRFRTVEHRQRQIGARRRDVDVGLRVDTGMLENIERSAQFGNRLIFAIRFAEQHRTVVMQGGEPTIIRSIGGARRIERLIEQFLSLIEISGGALRRRRVDQRRRPRLSALQPHAKRELERTLNNPLIVVMPALRTVESHRLVEHSEQAAPILGILGVGHRLLEVVVGLVFRRVIREQVVKTGEKRVHIERCVW